MLEIYNYVIGILIGILFFFSNHNESKIIIIKNCLITTVIYAISMSFINDYFLLSSLLKLIYFTICFMLIRKLNFFQSYYNSLIIVLFYLLSYVFLIFMLENSTQFSIFYSANIDCIAIFMSLMAFYYLNELSFLNNSVQFNIYDLVLIILINIILFIFMFILSYNFFINNLNYYLGLLILGFLLLSIIIVVSLNYCYILKRKEDINISMYKAQQLDKAYYQGLEIENEDLRKLKHDYKNHLLNLKQLIAYQNTEASLQYINKLINTNVTSKMNRFCNISYIDSYLNSIIESNNNINFDIHSTDLSQLSNMGFDILIILMNLIDNALENTSNNTINVDIVYNQDIIIKICNHSIKNPIKSHFKSSKGENHGLGLKIVNDIVMKYNGEAYDNYEKTLYSKYIILKTGAKTNEEINI